MSLYEPPGLLTDRLAATSLFDHVPESLTVFQRRELSFERARAIVKAYKFSVEDVLMNTDKFYNLWLDFIVTLDGASVALLGIQLNLVAGTLAPYVSKRPDLLGILEDIVTFRISGQFLLTELGHGLDALHLETTARLNNDGSFNLSTPSPHAAKWMPPTLPCAGTPCLGLVAARLLVANVDYGVKIFIVPLNDGKQMCTGVIAREFPTRTGSKALGHALTCFQNVTLPPQSLLGDIIAPGDHRRNFMETIHRVGVGSLTLSAVAIPGLKMAAYIGARYSMRRCVTGRSGRPMPIMSFRTQQLPILHCLAQGYVLEKFYRRCIEWLRNVPKEDLQSLNALQAIAKVTIIGHWRRTGCTIADRCGAQGTFDFNQIMPMEMELRGVAIAEGDVLGLSLRLVPELLLGRYSIPPADNPSSRLAVHERGLYKSLKDMLLSSHNDPRQSRFGQQVMPRCVSFVEAIGHRMAWEAALSSDVPGPIVQLYEIGAIGADVAWYVENMGLSQAEFNEEEDAVLSMVYSGLEGYLSSLCAESYAKATILSDKSWSNFVDTLPIWKGCSDYTPWSSLSISTKPHL